MPKALVTGASGQISSYLFEYLLGLGYECHGLDRRKAVSNHDNINHIKDKIKLIEGDLTDPVSITQIIKDGQYDELYNLGAMSHVGTSFKEPALTFEVNTMGVLYILEALKNHSPQTKMYQANTSEMFGSSHPPQNENTPFHPCSPYGAAKLSSFYLVDIYAKAFGLRAVSGIMFNSESKRRGKEFVSRKITDWVIAYKFYCNCVNSGGGIGGLGPVGDPNYSVPIKSLQLGNLDARRDWIAAKDSVRAIHMICNQDTIVKGRTKFEPYCFGSGQAHSVREFLDLALEIAFDLDTPMVMGHQVGQFEYIGKGVDEYLYDHEMKRTIMTINPEFYRPKEVDFLQCDYIKIKTELGWEPTISFEDLIRDMLGMERS